MVEHIRYNASDNPLIEKDFISHLNSSQAEFQIIVLRGLGQIKVENFNRITKLITAVQGKDHPWSRLLPLVYRNLGGIFSAGDRGKDRDPDKGRVSHYGMGQGAGEK